MSEKLTNFGEALEYLKLGFGDKIARKGWKGFPMVIMLQKGLAKFTQPFLYVRISHTTLEETTYHPWNPSHEDLLADDWFIVVNE